MGMRSFNSLSRDHHWLLAILHTASPRSFNSLSRDHLPVWFDMDAVSEFRTFNSLSRDHTLLSTYSSTPTSPARLESFNSLSRDHFKKLCEMKWQHDDTFNSLSRDHEALPERLLAGHSVDFQLPLSGSPESLIHSSSSRVTIASFNSLSRDHIIEQRR